MTITINNDGAIIMYGGTMMRKLTDFEKELPIYVVFSDGEACYASLDADKAGEKYQKLELDNIRYAEDSLDMSEEDSPLAVGFEAGYSGDHNYVTIISEGYAYFNDNEEFETEEGDIVMASDIDDCLDIGPDEDFDPLDFND